jgi:hypothetical protein
MHNRNSRKRRRRRWLPVSLGLLSAQVAAVLMAFLKLTAVI